ncbi:hypothetical protein L596_028587 [Steinernema carpocapsae]|uniref:Uncharacterized protein n=1 Tax=Steinernema carpocapsae TaxID=34508 RepID=A0A4U5LZT7_STECR|nr:hypothetical protein L596_028587 [Steinernema carpocapsae]
MRTPAALDTSPAATSVATRIAIRNLLVKRCWKLRQQLSMLRMPLICHEMSLPPLLLAIFIIFIILMKQLK